MKNKELIALLQQHNPDAEIYLDTFSAEDGGTGEVAHVSSNPEYGSPVVTIKEKRI